MKHAARFLFGALLGVALGYAFVLLTQRGRVQKRSVPFAVGRSAMPQSEEHKQAEEIAAS